MFEREGVEGWTVLTVFRGVLGAWTALTVLRRGGWVDCFESFNSFEVCFDSFKSFESGCFGCLDSF